MAGSALRPMAPDPRVLLVLLCLCRSLEGGLPRLALLKGRAQPPPRYMLHLYHRYREGREPHPTANTVRSFLPQPGRLGDRAIVVFNLTGIEPSEYIERADLHLEGRVDLVVLNLSHRPAVEEGGGVAWGRDLTEAVISCLEGGGHLLGLTTRDDRDLAAMSPFLIVFSEDNDRLDVGMLDVGRVPEDNELPAPRDEEGDRVEVLARLKHRPLEPRPKARPKRKRRGRKSLRLKWEKSWWRNDAEEGDEDSKEEEADPSVCGRKSLVIDFATIGWGEKIIAPKKFEAYRCAGECPSPLPKVVHPSNHASLQSRVRGAGHPCCAPSTLSRVPVLFVDARRNLVIKSFPDMSVESCSCL